jgi:hypothetical protein
MHQETSDEGDHVKDQSKLRDCGYATLTPSARFQPLASVAALLPDNLIRMNDW